MSEQRLHPGELLNGHGALCESGYAATAVKNYDRRDIKSSPFRIKEWDEYLIYNEDYGISLTVADFSYCGFITISIYDLIHQSKRTKTEQINVTFGKFHMPASPDFGDICYENNDTSILCFNDGKKRKLEIHRKDFYGQDLNAKFIMTTIPDGESIVTAIPFSKHKKAFSYDFKAIGLNTTGYVTCGERIYSFHEDSRAIFNWNRGVWPYKVSRYWGAASGRMCDQNIGINIACGFGNIELGSENAIFINGQLHKLDQIVCKSQKEERFCDPINFVSVDHKFHAIFTPIFNCKSEQKMLFFSNKEDQIFGYYHGSYEVSSDETIVFDHLMGFYKKITSKW